MQTLTSGNVELAYVDQAFTGSPLHRKMSMVVDRIRNGVW